MCIPGEWGTDAEIAAAAHLLNVSILCFSKHSAHGDYQLQHFAPHFTTNRDCNNDCHHQTLYLVNEKGSHYELATVMTVDNTDL